MTESPTIGHNSTVDDQAAARLKSIVERHENLEAEIKDRRADQKDILLEAKSSGFDPKVIRQLLRIRKQDPAEREEQETLLAIYQRAMGE